MSAGGAADDLTHDITMGRVRARRADLHAVMVSLEAALARPALGRPREWSSDVRAVLVRLDQAVAEHVAATESPDGLLAEASERAPRLTHECRRLMEEHQSIVGCSTAVHRALDEGPEAAREAALSLLALLARHRQAGADLIYEAYDVDLGGSE